MNLSQQFSKNVRAALTDSELQEVNFLNSEETSSIVCHTHDFCDANELMSTAFSDVYGNDLNVGDESHIEIINNAWNQSKISNFQN